jgi:putative tryptophan/tyrosine transport system substrate-binding protein
MKRRAFLLTACALALVPPAIAQRKDPFRIGVILTTSPLAEMLGPEPIHPRLRAFLHEMRRLGYSEGGNLVVERRSAEGKFERFSEILSELLRLKPDILMTLGAPMTLAAMNLTNRIPIISMGVPDHVAAGIVTSLAKPGGNVTGVSSTTGPEYSAKRLELLKAAIPSASRVAYLAQKTEWDSPGGNAARGAARALGITLTLAETLPTDYAAAFASIRREKPNAVYVSGHLAEWANRESIVEALNAMKLPNIHAFSESAEAGGLLSFAPPVNETWLRAAYYADRILKGAKPSDLPIEQPTRFQLVVNLKAAKALGIVLPQSFLLRADKVIE